MSEQLEIINEPLEQLEREGIVYSYPPTRMSAEQIKLAAGLSISHAKGDIVALAADPEKYPAQGACYLAAEPPGVDFAIKTAGLMEKRFEKALERVLNDERKLATLTKMGTLLEEGGNVVNALPHGPLPDIGLMHVLPYAALKRLGYNFRSGIILSQGVACLGHKFNGVDVPITTAFSWACDKIWLVVPRTKKVQESEFSKSVPEAQIKDQNALVRADIGQEQDKGGLFLTGALSATSYVIDKETNLHQLVAPTMGTLKTLAHDRTYIQVVVGEIQDTKDMPYEFWGELRQLAGDEAMLRKGGDIILTDMTNGLNAVILDTQFAYLRAKES